MQVFTPKSKLRKSTPGKNCGFTLIELMVAILIFSIIAIISYRTLSSLITTKEVSEASQAKWGGIANAISRISTAVNRAIPLPIRDANGIIQPAILGKAKLSGKYDAQLEFTMSGFVGELEHGNSPPTRIGFRYVNNNLYLVLWPVLNRTLQTRPDLKLLIPDLKQFQVKFLYPDKNWYDVWPMNNLSYTTFPVAVRVNMTTQSGEEIMRQWTFRR